MDFKKTLTVEVNQKGVSSTANALGKLATKAQEVRAPLKQAQGSLEDFSKVKLDGITLEVKGVADQVKSLGLNTKGLGELTSGFKGISGSFTSIATAAERMANSTTGLEAFNTKLQAIRDTLQSMQGLSGTLTSVAKVPSGVTVRGGVGGSTADPDKVLATQQKRFINDVTRQNIVATQGKAAYLEYRAAQLGVTEQTGSMIASLRATEKQMQKVGGMTRETAAAMRMVPAQFTDIVTQLAGGQNPFLIMIQQGGQLRDMFHGFGPMFRSVGPMVLKFLTNPFTIAATALGTLAAGFYFGSQEAENFGKATILTGNYVGMTKDKFSELTAEAGKLAGGQSAAAEAMTALASTGKITGENIERLTVATSNFARASGMDVEKVAAQYASLKDAPAAAILKLNESYHFLSEATYEQIKALEKEGKTLEATKLAQESLAQAHENMANQLVQNLGWVERVGNSVAEMYRKIKNAVLDVGREVPAAEQLLTMRAQIASMEAEGARRRTFGGNLLPEEQSKLDNLKKQVSALSALNGMNEASIKNANARQAAEERATAAADRLGKLEEQGTAKVKLKAEAYKKLERDLAALREVNPKSELLSSSSIAEQKAAIEKQFGEKGGGIKSSDSRLASLRAELEALKQETVGLQEQGSEYEKLNEHAKRLLAVKDLLASGKGKKEQISALQQEQAILEKINEQYNINAGLKKQNDEVKRQKAVADEMEVTSLALQDQIAYLEESGAVSDTRTKAEKAYAQAKKDSLDEELSLEARNSAAINSILIERVVNEERLAKAKLQTNAARLKADQADLENANTIQNLAESQQKELEWLALSNKEREKAQALWAIELDARKKILAIEKEKEGLKGNEKALAQKDREIQGIRDTAQAQTSLAQAFEKTKESGLGFYGDLRIATKNWFDSLPTQQQELQSIFTSVYSQMSDTMATFLSTGKADWSNFTKSVLTNISQMLFKISMLKAAEAASSLFGGSSRSDLSGMASLMSDFGSAKGNAFTGQGVAAFAQGGSFTNAVVNQPTMFAFANGGAPGLGVIGEKPGSVGEAVMPLTRDSKGDLAVSAVGGGGSQVNIEINIASDGSSSVTGGMNAQDGAKSLAAVVRNAVKAELIRQSRSNGMIDKGR